MLRVGRSFENSRFDSNFIFLLSTMLRSKPRARCAVHMMLPLLLLVASLSEGQTGSDEQGTESGDISHDSLRVGLRGGESLASDDYFRYQFEAMGIDFDSDISRADRELFLKRPQDMVRVSILERLFGRRRLDEGDTTAVTDDASSTTSSTYDDLTDENVPSPMPTMGNVGYPMPTARHDGPEDMIWKNQLIDDEVRQYTFELAPRTRLVRPTHTSYLPPPSFHRTWASNLPLPRPAGTTRRTKESATEQHTGLGRRNRWRPLCWTMELVLVSRAKSSVTSGGLHQHFGWTSKFR